MQEQLYWKWRRKAGIVTSAEYGLGAVENQNPASAEEISECDETKQSAVIASQAHGLQITLAKAFLALI